MSEPAGSQFHLTVRAKTYPIQKFLGLCWTYMGPLPAPEIPPYDVWMRRDGHHRVQFQPRLDCNWIQVQEGSIDSSHVGILHLDTLAVSSPGPRSVGSFDFAGQPWDTEAT